jgi:hypothetical protein
MSISLVRLATIGCALLGWLAVPAPATTYVVDSNGGGQFTDIAPAIAAAQPGDVLLVMPGVYNGFTLDKGLTIIGYGTVTVAGDASVVGVPAGQTAALVALAPQNLSFTNCSGPVLAQDFAAVQHIAVSGCTDARIRRVDTSIPDGPPMTACGVTASRAELVRCSLRASSAQECASGVDGGTGLTITGASRVQLARSGAYGGNGSYCFDEPYPQFVGGNGGPGVVVGSADTLYLTGGGVGQVFGGSGGLNFFYDYCLYDGSPSSGIAIFGGTLRYSGTTSYGPSSQYGLNCVDLPGIPIGGTGHITQVVPDDPTLDTSGVPTAGGSATFTLSAPAGSSAILYFGRHAVLIPDPNTAIEQLTTKSRIVHLGTIPASGVATFTWPIAAGLPPGTLLIAQSEITLASGEVRRTNSVPVVLR